MFKKDLVIAAMICLGAILSGCKSPGGGGMSGGGGDGPGGGGGMGGRPCPRCQGGAGGDGQFAGGVPAGDVGPQGVSDLPHGFQDPNAIGGGPFTPGSGDPSQAFDPSVGGGQLPPGQFGPGDAGFAEAPSSVGAAPPGSQLESAPGTSPVDPSTAATQSQQPGAQSHDGETPAGQESSRRPTAETPASSTSKVYMLDENPKRDGVQNKSSIYLLEYPTGRPGTAVPEQLAAEKTEELIINVDGKENIAIRDPFVGKGIDASYLWFRNMHGERLETMKELLRKGGVDAKAVQEIKEIKIVGVKVKESLF